MGAPISIELKVPLGLTLKPFQIEGVQFMIKSLQETGGVYNADEMGLGKSIQTAVITNSTLKSIRNLIICQAVMRLTWQEELARWCPNAKSFVAECSADMPEYGNQKYFICSYDFATKFAVQLGKMSFDILILDESHHVKNTDSKRTKAILTKLWDKCAYRICLSGTPFTNNVLDLYTLAHKLNPAYFTDYYSFRDLYAEVEDGIYGKKYYGIRNLEHLKIGLKPFFIRRTKEQVLPELPPKQFQRISLPAEYQVQMTKDEAEAHKKYLEDLKKFLKSSNRRGNPPPPPKSLATVRREQGLKKLKPITEFCNNLLDQGIPIVVFTFHVELLLALEKSLSTRKPVKIYGETTSTKRQEAIKAFQGGDTNLFLGQIQAAGSGITLTRSSTVILSELSYSPTEIDQAVSRCHRIGQRDSVSAYYFTVSGSVDEEVEQIAISKAETFKEILE